MQQYHILVAGCVSKITRELFSRSLRSAQGLGCAKTQANAGHVEVSRTKWCITESNRAVLIQFDGALENCVFYILPVYEFSHSQGHSRRFRRLCRMSAVPPIATEERTSILSAKGQQRSTFRLWSGPWGSPKDDIAFGQLAAGQLATPGAVATDVQG